MLFFDVFGQYNDQKIEIWTAVGPILEFQWVFPYFYTKSYV